MNDDRMPAEPIDTGAGATPVMTICSLTEPVRAAAAGSALLDLGNGIQIDYQLQVERALIRRTVHELGGIIDDVNVRMRHECISCSLQEEIVAAVSSWAERGRPIVVGLPPTIEPAEVVHALTAAAASQPGRFRVAQVLAAVDVEVLKRDLFGEDLLDDRGIAYCPTDRRAVGEALAHQIEFADVIAYETGPTERTGAILDHLLPAEVGRTDLHRLDGRSLLRPRPAVDTPPAGAGCGSLEQSWRGNPADGAATGAPDRAGIWTIELRSDRPFSPHRLRSEIAGIGAGRIRGRGRFWVPTRPDLRCAWDGVGGQLSIGPAGPWQNSPGQNRRGECRRETRLVITGADGDPQPIRAAFERALLTDDELHLGESAWAVTDDGLDPWLGMRVRT